MNREGLIESARSLGWNRFADALQQSRAAAIATAAIVVFDLVLSPRIAAFQRQPNGLWLRSAVLLGLWCVLIMALQPWFERRAERKLQSEAASMSFARARALVVAQLARKPEDPYALSFAPQTLVGFDRPRNDAVLM